MARAQLTLSSKNYSSWSLRAWLLCRMAGLPFDEVRVDIDDPDHRQDLLLLSSSERSPRLEHDGVAVWDTLAIAEYLVETMPDASLLPVDRAARAHCRAVSGEMHSGFYNLRSALPMNLKARHGRFKIFSGARPDIARVEEIWADCLARYGGPWLFGTQPSLADAMYAPVCTRFRTYDVALSPTSQAYCEQVFSWPSLLEWTAEALKEPEVVVELEVEF
jgi:glutathione S-transferase